MARAGQGQGKDRAGQGQGRARPSYLSAHDKDRAGQGRKARTGQHVIRTGQGSLPILQARNSSQKLSDMQHWSSAISGICSTNPVEAPLPEGAASGLPQS